MMLYFLGVVVSYVFFIWRFKLTSDLGTGIEDRMILFILCLVFWWIMTPVYIAWKAGESLLKLFISR